MNNLSDTVLREAEGMAQNLILRNAVSSLSIDQITQHFVTAIEIGHELAVAGNPATEPEPEAKPHAGFGFVKPRCEGGQVLPNAVRKGHFARTPSPRRGGSVSNKMCSCGLRDKIAPATLQPEEPTK